jgi:FtsP/CotA-like multicopper oxidase with cupredoxin domain
MSGKLVPSETDVKGSFAAIFKSCEENGSPSQWSQWTTLSGNFPAQQMGTSSTVPGGWINDYDKQAAYKPMPLWPPNETVIKAGGWPQFYIGAFPYCFRLPRYNEVVKPGTKPTLMGQAPGTHWYHAHKHGSTDINVSDGMTGAFIIEGEYDDVLNGYYAAGGAGNQGGLTQQVMVFQQLTTVPRILSSTGGGAAAVAVNGRRQPVVTMKPNEVQLWRMVNTNSRSLVTLCQFAPAGPLWVQTAQDGVQLAPTNYNPAATNTVLNLASGNRVDLLVQAPSQTGTYQLQMLSGVAPSTASQCTSTTTTTLLTVQVQGTAVGKPNNFIPQNTSSPCKTSPSSFPCLPEYLDDIKITNYDNRRELVFNSVKNVAVPTAPNSNPNPKNPPFPGALVGRTSNSSHFINDKQFEDHTVDQVMKLDTVEEWKISNLTATSGPGLIWHPFHIHINPFQVTAVFDPNSMTQPLQLPGPWVWWDVFAIPAGLQTLTQCTQSSGTYSCPNPDGGSCSVPTQVCTVQIGNSTPVTAACTQANQSAPWVCPNPKGSACSSTQQQMCRGKIVPGFFTMRTRFADFTGQYVLHCHILAHEDRGMMQLIEVVPNTSIYGHD